MIFLESLSGAPLLKAPTDRIAASANVEQISWAIELRQLGVVPNIGSVALFKQQDVVRIQ
jgi:hypothetical protein